ncbi:MAG: hypothetical protein K0S33_3188 [Bacteroidetes bacterium]|jgi:hypothetical protein|nr:hypothetical protein [Bacteroidota bacterium]
MPAYVTPVANVNVQKEQGQFQNTTFIGLTHVEDQLAYNVSKNTFVQGEMYFSRSVKYGALGVGRYTKFAKGRLMNTSSAGYGFGVVDYVGIRQFSNERGVLNYGGRETMYDTRRISIFNTMMKIYLQSNLTLFSRNERHSFSVGTRLHLLAYLRYKYYVDTYRTTHYGIDAPRPPYGTPGMTNQYINEFGKLSAVWDNYFTYTVKVKSHVQVFFQALLNTPINNADRKGKYHLINDPFRPLLSTGVTFTLGPKKKQ